MTMRTFISEDPYAAADTRDPWQRGKWPCRWVMCSDAGEPPFATAYRRKFTTKTTAKVRVHVSADERYELFLDGERIGRGSERGDANHWYYESYHLILSAGRHVIVARVWSLGAMAPYAQMSVYPGFIFSPQDKKWIELLGTGVAPWEAKQLGGYEFTDPAVAWGTGARLIVHGAKFDWGFERGAGGGWKPVVTRDEGADAVHRNEIPPSHLMLPATLPPMMEEPRHVGSVRHVAKVVKLLTRPVPIRADDNLHAEHAAWQRLISANGALTIPPRTRRRVLIDLQDYYCAYPELVTSGGAGSFVRVQWTEALYEQIEGRSKGHRDEIEGKFFSTANHVRDDAPNAFTPEGVGDIFCPDGGKRRKFETLWWECGRYVEIVVETKTKPLVIEDFVLRETRYPLEMESAFECDDARLTSIIPLGVRALQMCSHETYMDCPFYEQLMYVGDTRLEVLTTFALTRDDRLPRKALRMFDASRLLTGLTQSRYPSRVLQKIPPFSLWYVAMLHDFALWRGDLEFVRELMSGARGVLDYFQRRVNADGLVEAPRGWNYMDWVRDDPRGGVRKDKFASAYWQYGTPPDAQWGVSGVVNLQFALVLRQAAELEEWFGDSEMAARWRKLSARITTAVTTAFWDEARGLFADDLKHEHFSEHSQCLALLGEQLDASRRELVAGGLFEDKLLARATIYFTHYLFETCRLTGRMDKFFERMPLWFGLKENGLRTTIEMPEPTRSDCHAWGAHPLFHYFATVLGIRPAAPGFASVEITPQLGPLAHATGTLVHPRGEIAVDVRRRNGGIAGEIVLPFGVSGVFRAQGRETQLKSGLQQV
jgi:hypothetical protein